MKKRTIVLLTLLVVWSAVAFADFATNGGWIRIFREVETVTAPVDTVVQVDTVKITNAQNDTIRIDFGELAAIPSAWGVITFIVGDNTDTVRYFTADLTDTVADTIDLTVDLTVATAANDSAILTWYSNIVKADTAISPIFREAPVFSKNAFLARAVDLSNVDSTGLTFVIQHRIGDNGTWATVTTLGLMTETDTSVATADTLAAANLLYGNQWRVLRIFADSVGGTVRRTALETEVWWRGLR